MIRKHSPSRIQIQELTPDDARTILARNGRNRTLSRGLVAQFARDMGAGRWDFNGDTIRIARDGTLLDGQHRLHAVVESGCTIETIVVRDLPRETQQTMDTGRRRNLRDQLVIEGIAHARELAPILRMATQMQLGSLTLTPSESEQRQMLADNPDLADAAEFAARARRRLPVTSGPFGCAYWTCLRAGGMDAVTEFFDPVITGAGLAAGDPRLALRNKFIEPRGDRRALSATDIYGYTVRAWNAWREGRTLTKLQAPKSSVTNNGRATVGFTKSNLPAAL